MSAAKKGFKSPVVQLLPIHAAANSGFNEDDDRDRRLSGAHTRERRRNLFYLKKERIE